MNTKSLLIVLLTFGLFGCSGLSYDENNETFSAHAESVNILFLQVPGQTSSRAESLIPENANVTTVNSNANDVTSLFGVMNRLFGFEFVKISGTVEKE
ncbi:hypothetical protein HJ107_23985 [Vibrio parahaemolyticus]|nr:hypothetical protein [Vibrio parahaemolyticus]